MRVVVVGAGVIGLACAIRAAEAGHLVRVVAERRTPHTTSDVAAAIWFPYLAEPRDRMRAWGAATLAELRRAARDPGSGVAWTPARIVDAEADPWWKGLVDGFRPLPGRLAWGHAFACEVPVVAMPRHMAWLERRARRHGVSIEARRVRSLARVPGADVVVNASGLGARELAGDPTLVAIQGQVARVQAPHVTTAVLVESDPPTYVIPRPDGVVVGGTAVRGAEDVVPDHAVEADILRRAAAEEPRLAGAPVLARAVGVRPGRPTIRLERDAAWPVPVVHCYGHGGSGVTLAWGCADEVRSLLAARVG